MSDGTGETKSQSSISVSVTSLESVKRKETAVFPCYQFHWSIYFNETDNIFIKYHSDLLRKIDDDYKPTVSENKENKITLFFSKRTK